MRFIENLVGPVVALIIQLCILACLIALLTILIVILVKRSRRPGGWAYRPKASEKPLSRRNLGWAAELRGTNENTEPGKSAQNASDSKPKEPDKASKKRTAVAAAKAMEAVKAAEAIRRGQPTADLQDMDIAAGGELVAVMTAAIEAYRTEGFAGNLVVRKITRLPGNETAWGSAAKADCIESRRL